MNAILERLAQDVTPERVEKCSKVYDYQLKQNVYFVENSKGDCDEHGIIEYKVTYTQGIGFQCNCKAGQYGFHNCRGQYCWHVRASIASSIEDRKALVLRANEERRIAEEQARKAVEPIEVRWNI